MKVVVGCIMTRGKAATPPTEGARGEEKKTRLSAEAQRNGHRRPVSGQHDTEPLQLERFSQQIPDISCTVLVAPYISEGEEPSDDDTSRRVKSCSFTMPHSVTHRGESAHNGYIFYLSNRLCMFLVLFFSLFIAFCMVRASSDLFLYF